MIVRSEEQQYWCTHFSPRGLLERHQASLFILRKAYNIRSILVRNTTDTLVPVSNKMPTVRFRACCELEAAFGVLHRSG